MPHTKKDDFKATLQDAKTVILRQLYQPLTFNLENTKKRAKTLLKDIRLGNADAISRFAAHHPKVQILDQPKLSDAQLVIARELGYRSWPDLKNHYDLIHQTEQDISNHLPLDCKRTLHLRCGTDIKEVIDQCGFEGDFQEIINPFTLGPVPLPEPIGDFVTARENFIKNYFKGYIPEEIKNQSTDAISITEKEETFIRSLPQQYTRIVLWLEYDAYDQLCLTHLLWHFKRLNLKGATLELIQVEQFPGLERFIGIGQLSSMPAVIRSLWQSRQPINQSLINCGESFWNAYTSGSAQQLFNIVKSHQASAPVLAKAFLRMLKELPDSQTGLALTEHYLLRIIQKEQTIDRRRLYLFLVAETDMECFLGDLMLFPWLDRLENNSTPLILRVSENGGNAVYQLTELAERILEGEETWLNYQPSLRWVGGIKLDFKENLWLWNSDLKAPEFITC